MSLPLQPLLCVETHHRTPPISKQCVRVRVTPVCMSSHWQIKAFLWGLHRGPGIFGSLSWSRSLDLNCTCNLSLDLGLGFWLSEPGLLGRVATDLFPSVRVGISVKAGQQSLQLGPFGILGLTTLGVTRALTTSVAAFIASHCGPASSAGLPCYASRQSACSLGTWSWSLVRFIDVIGISWFYFCVIFRISCVRCGFQTYVHACTHMRTHTHTHTKL